MKLRRYVPLVFALLAGQIALAQTLILPHLQHCGLLEEPVLFTEPLLRFLDTALSQDQRSLR